MTRENNIIAYFEENSVVMTQIKLFENYYSNFKLASGIIELKKDTFMVAALIGDEQLTLFKMKIDD
jgi:hypothetical protein